MKRARKRDRERKRVRERYKEREDEEGRERDTPMRVKLCSISRSLYLQRQASNILYNKKISKISKGERNPALDLFSKSKI